jgi:3'-phosphoadenosine 5'-phosphosulfate sulfotransferase (PAPS reductase)/FAD synthetase
MKNLFISFSGGKTSAYMAKRLMDEYRGKLNIIVLFSNTGQEHPETLDFVERCDKAWNLGVIWLEAITHHGERKACTYKVVDHASACRDGSIFEEVIKKYGLPNRSYLHCTRELKTNPMHLYIKERFGINNYHTAIGIRADEITRVNEHYKKLKYWYPLLDWDIREEDILKFWEQQPFKLNIPQHYGNCTWCWKKTLSKHLALIEEIPEIYDIPRGLQKYTSVNVKPGQENRVMFREKRSVEDLFKIHAAGGRHIFEDEYFNDCAESCEPF